eukprot:scaffold43299_cov20-Tisochrysis_lutea.AAC.2
MVLASCWPGLAVAGRVTTGAGAGAGAGAGPPKAASWTPLRCCLPYPGVLLYPVAIIYFVIVVATGNLSCFHHLSWNFIIFVEQSSST